MKFAYKEIVLTSPAFMAKYRLKQPELLILLRGNKNKRSSEYYRNYHPNDPTWFRLTVSPQDVVEAPPLEEIYKEVME